MVLTMDKINIKKEVWNSIFTIFAAILSSVTLWVFVYPANFAPSGVDGISTMLYQITGVNAGVFSLVINLPLLCIAWFILKRRYVIYTVVFTVLSSVVLIVLEQISFYQYIHENGGLLAAIFSGVLLGVRTGTMLRLSASTGGVDIVAGICQQKFPYIRIEKIISLLCYAIILLSFFLYRDLNCILLSIVQMFVFEKSVTYVLKDDRDAVELKIVTKTPERLKKDIIFNLKHGATIVESKGMFTDEESNLVLSVVNLRQVPEFLKIIKKYPDTFVYYTDVSGVNGNFRWKKDDVAK